MTMRASFIAAVVIALAGSAVMAQAPTPPPAYRVIVNPRNAVTSIERRFLGQAFLKKITQWSDGVAIRPVDQQADSTVRRRFTDEVLNRSVAAVRSYWQHIIFSGRNVPPPELNSDEEVVRYVLRYPGAVGYVSGGANTGAAKVVAVR